MAIGLTESSKGRPNDADWLALMMRTESDKQFEWPYIGQVAINRLEDTKREFRGLSDMADVVLQPQQWSFFNPWTASTGNREEPEIIYLEASKRFDMYDLFSAYGCARVLLGQQRWLRLIGPEVLFCWAPAAMRPPNTDPAWSVRLAKFRLPNVPRWKFAYYPEDV